MKFTTSVDLKRHQRRKHTFGKPFNCAGSGVKLTTRSQLKRHQFYKPTHQHANDFFDFEYNFFEKATLLRYQCRKQTFEKTFKCYFCFKQFVSIDLIKLHKQSHTGV